MICPNCKCEYIRGVTQCADCDVPLVDKLEARRENPLDNVRIVAIWQGKDPTECEAVEKALESADIPFTAPNRKEQFSFLPTEPSLEIWIAETDQDRAKQALLDVQRTIDPSELTPEELESLALPESDDLAEDEEPSERWEFSEHWFEDEPIAEVWNGDSEQFADYLSACLRETGVVSRKASDSGRWSLAVPQKLESRAKKVVGEVVQSSPPN